MATDLRIESLTVATNDGQHTFRFPAPLTFVTGNVGMGKSSLMMLIKHALGGEAKLTPAVRQHAKFVDLAITAGATSLILRRRIGVDSNTVEIVEPGSGIIEQLLPVSPTPADGPSISRRLLEFLELPIERVSTSRRGINSRTVPITFNDIFAYCYLQAKEIDRSVVGHLDAYRNQRRVAAFELMFGLNDPELRELQRRRGVEKDLIKQLGQDIAAIDRFIAGAGYQPAGTLQLLRLQLLKEVASSDALLREVQAEVAALIAAENERRMDLAAAVVDANAAREQIALAAVTVRAREAALAQLRLEQTKVERLGHAVRSLAPFEYSTCPRCMQSLTQRVLGESVCLLCCQHVEPITAVDTDASGAATNRLSGQITETEQLLGVDYANAASAAEAEARATERVARLHAEFDRATASVVSPRMETVARLSAQAESTRQKIREVDRIAALWRQLGQLRETQNSHKKAEKALLVDIKAREEQAQQRGDILTDLNEIFREEVTGLGIPVQGQPRIDETTYLPMIGESDFESLQASGGGVSTALNVAYHLTLLSYAANRDVRLPSLLMIDSPRKAIGNTPGDRELGRRIYERFMTIAQTLKVQLIVADNDAPLDIIGRTPRIELTSDRSTIPGVINTGVGLGTRVEDL